MTNATPYDLAPRQWGDKAQVKELRGVLEKTFKSTCIVFPANCIMDVMFTRDGDPVAIGLVRFINDVGMSSVRLEETEIQTFNNWWHILREDGDELKQIIVMVDNNRNAWWCYFSDVDENRIINIDKWRVLVCK